MMIRSAFSVCILLITCLSVNGNESIHYQAAGRNIPYKSVVTLPYTEPVNTIPYGKDPLQYGLLWLPLHSAQEKGFPVVIFIHGGCWLNAYDINHSRPLTTALSQDGFAVWSLEYRRTGDEGGGWPGTFDDIRRGINHLSRMDNHLLDLSRIYLVGHSAGGHLALLAASETLGVNLTKIIGLAAISDLNGYAAGNNSCQQATGSFMGGLPADIASRYEEASPLEKSFASPVMLLHGTQDSIVPARHSRMDNAGWRSLDEGGHFDWIHPGSDAYKMLLEELEHQSGSR